MRIYSVYLGEVHSMEVVRIRKTEQFQPLFGETSLAFGNRLRWHKSELCLTRADAVRKALEECLPEKQRFIQKLMSLERYEAHLQKLMKVVEVG